MTNGSLYTKRWREKLISEKGIDFYRNYRNEEQKRYRSIYQLRFQKKLKLEILNHYGSKCECCGESSVEFLTVDHINGGGTAHRKQLNKSGTGFYKWLRKNNYPKGFRILCYNCNCSLGISGYCPHESSRNLLGITG